VVDASENRCQRRRILNDRQLLEAAAKAAGIDVEFDKNNDTWTRPVRMDRCVNARVYWNPLKDDGDAFRLAVKLGIEVGNYHQYGKGFALFGLVEFWDDATDPYAATRRAIVLAAAAIGAQGGKEG
jgi:hypothetical protein